MPSSVWRSAPPAAALSDGELPWELRTAQSLTDGIRARTSSARPLDLLVDLHDAESGLSSEGVWHNAWLGVAYVQTARELRRQGRLDEAEEPFDLAVQLADSLYENSFDEGFRRRTASGIWRSAESSASAIEAAGESIAFYSESRERRSAQNAAAVVFYSLLADEAAARESGDAPRIARLCDEVGVSFLDLFFDEAHGRFRRGALRSDGRLARTRAGRAAARLRAASARGGARRQGQGGSAAAAATTSDAAGRGRARQRRAAPRDRGARRGAGLWVEPMHRRRGGRLPRVHPGRAGLERAAEPLAGRRRPRPPHDVEEGGCGRAARRVVQNERGAGVFLIS